MIRPSLLVRISALSLFVLTIGCGPKANPPPDTEVYDTEVHDTEIMVGEIQVLESAGTFTCIPPGDGPFPGVLYNHGGLGPVVGGDLEATCLALAEAGYVGHSPLRRATKPLTGHLDDVLDGLDALLSEDAVDTTRIGILGFSRGGLLTLQAIKTRPDVFDATVLMAPAPGGTGPGGLTNLESELKDVSMIASPVLILVSENDLYQADHVTLADLTEAALSLGGHEVDLILYPPWGEDGHEMFWEVGDYWDDIVGFLGPLL